MTENTVTCCGRICSGCPYYQKECGGCSKIQGKPFWPEYIGKEWCGIYRCCMEERKLPHCGRRSELPYGRYDQQDSARAPEGNAVGLKEMLEVFRPPD